MIASGGTGLRSGRGSGRGETATLVAVAAVCGALFVAAVATAFVSGGWALVVVLGWLALFAAGCFVFCASRLLGKNRE